MFRDPGCLNDFPQLDKMYVHLTAFSYAHVFGLNWSLCLPPSAFKTLSTCLSVGFQPGWYCCFANAGLDWWASIYILLSSRPIQLFVIVSFQMFLLWLQCSLFELVAILNLWLHIFFSMCKTLDCANKKTFLQQCNVLQIVLDALCNCSSIEYSLIIVW